MLRSSSWRAQNLASYGDRVRLVHAPFSQIRSVLEQAAALPLDGCIADLGVSSVQLDQPERGFSFRRSGPLDMRMDRSQGETAADLLQRVDEEELARVLHDLGEERFARKIARAVTHARESGELTSTGALASLVAALGSSSRVPRIPQRASFRRCESPSTTSWASWIASCKTRLAVCAPAAAWSSSPSTRWKTAWSSAGSGRWQQGTRRASAPRFQILTKHVITASASEVARNPRARSAKLRAAERLPS